MKSSIHKSHSLAPSFRSPSPPQPTTKIPSEYLFRLAEALRALGVPRDDHIEMLCGAVERELLRRDKQQAAAAATATAAAAGTQAQSQEVKNKPTSETASGDSNSNKNTLNTT